MDWENSWRVIIPCALVGVLLWAAFTFLVFHV